MRHSIFLWFGITLASQAVADSSRDYISVVGSSTVYPFATVVAEQFGKSGKFKTPKIESTGTGGGLKAFCAGIGPQFPDITNASRRIKQSEYDNCQKNGIKEIVEVKIGYDGIAVAQAKQAKALPLTRRQLFLALAKQVPDPKNPKQLIANPNLTWQDVDPALPPRKIEVLGPPPTSGTRDAFVELALEGGCQEFPEIKALKESNEAEYKRICQTVREDGAYVEAGENDNLIVQKLGANPDALGIFGYSFLDQNRSVVVGETIDGVAPEFEAIAGGKYPVSRPLYVYVKKAHVPVIKGISQFLAEFTSEKAWGDDGYLADRGMIPMPAEERKEFAQAAKNLKPLALDGGKKP